MVKKPQRAFIGWSRPVLEHAAERLFHEHARNGVWDLRGWLIVLPGGLATRRMQELLALRAEATQHVLYPPEIVTVGRLPETLYAAKFPFASDMVQVLAWCQALQQADARRLETFVPLPPRSGAAEQWLELGRILSGVHRELASDLLNFDRVAAVLGEHPEAPRWHALAAVQRGYLRVLDDLGLWDIQTARMVALDRKEPVADRDILMLGAVDLNRTQRGFLEAVAERAHIWIAAPPESADQFDSFGCLVTTAWEGRELDLPTENLLVGKTPADQIELAVACLAELGNSRPALHVRSITLGVPDPTLVPVMEQHMARVGVKMRYGPGSPLTRSEPAQLLELVGKYLRNRNYQDFAALVRHPVVSHWINEWLKSQPPEVSPEVSPEGYPLKGVREGWLAELDSYYAQVLPRVIEPWVQAKARGAATYLMVVQAIDRWLEPLMVASRNLEDWCQPLLEMLQTVYKVLGGHDAPSDQEKLVKACQGVAEQIMQLRDIPEALTLSVSASDAIDWLIHGMAGALVAETADSEAIEMLGWLELPLDDAEVLVLAGIHDGVVPESVNADPFLPNQLRRQLGMMDNARRYARDMYAFHVIRHTRQELRVVVGRTNLAGDPLVPSRLLLACPLEQLPSRVLKLVEDEQVDCLPEVITRWQTAASDSSQVLGIPEPNPARIPPHVSVTAFRTYLACPYRFYLKHVCGLSPSDDRDTELSGGQFGDLVHDTLHRLFLDSMAHTTDVEVLSQYLCDTVGLIAEEKYGPHPAAAIRVQIAQAQDRLTSFANIQAARVAAGWEIKHCEIQLELKAGDHFLGQPLPLGILGRVDRIDYHAATGRWAIWDYKTSDSGTKPVQNHYSPLTGWHDLQLPLYRHLFGTLATGVMPTVGYCLLTKTAKDIQFVEAEFTAEQLAEADQKSMAVIQAIARGVYQPRTEVPLDYDDFARICQVGIQRDVPARPKRKVRDGRGRSSLQPCVPASQVATARKRLASPTYWSNRANQAEPLPAVLIRASAGTGKTFQLSNRLLRIILSGQGVDHILATTFTRKAAGEILQRVLVRLAGACLDADKWNALQTELPDLDFDEADCLAALRRVTSQLNRFRVSTLDSFYAQIARTFSMELHLAPGWTAIDPVREAAVRMQAIQRLLDKKDQRTLVDLVRLLAKGETKRSVAAQIEETVQGGYQYYRAAQSGAFGKLEIPAGPTEGQLREAVEFLERHDAKHQSIRKSQTALVQSISTGDWEQAIGNGLLTKGLSTGSYYGRDLAPELLQCLQVLQRKCAAEILPVRRAQTTAAFELLDAFNSEYLAVLRAQRMLSFADITYLLSRWMNPTSGQGAGGLELPSMAIDQRQLQFRLDCNIDHLLLDEFQDTAPDQWRILEPLAKPLVAKPAATHSFFCVGDSKQAIYGWRGGVAAIFDAVGESLSGINESTLATSYRSSQPVMDVVNRVFKHLTDHENYGDYADLIRHWSVEFPPHSTARTNLPGYIEVLNGITPPQHLPKEERNRLELEFAAGRIADLARQAPGRSIGVLFRDNDSVAILIELLRRRGVSASQEGGNPLTDSAAVELVLSLLHCGDHPGDSIAAYHVQQSPLISSMPHGVGSSSHTIAHWLRESIARHGLGRSIGRVCDALAPHVSWWDQHRLTQLISLAFQFEAGPLHRLSDFEAFVEQQRVALPSEAQVKVMTIHSSKGLEFDAVFLPDLQIPLAGQPPLLVAKSSDPCSPPEGILRYVNDDYQKLLPRTWQQAFYQAKAQKIEETLCVLYVAMTRARNALYMITKPRSSSDRRGTQSCDSIIQSILSPPELLSKPEALLIHPGAADWYAADDVTKPCREDQSLDATSAPLVMRLATDAASSPRRGLRIASPSTLAIEKSMRLDRLFSVNEMVGGVVGSALHACFEQVQWLEDFSWDEERLRAAIRRALTPEQLRHISVEQQLVEFQRLLQLPAIRQSLSRERYQCEWWGKVPDQIEVENERRISLVFENQLIDGCIDRLVLLSQQGRLVGAEIIDYKTDQRDLKEELHSWQKRRVEYHRPQLQTYAKVVSNMMSLPLDKIECSLVLLSAGVRTPVSLS